MLKNLANMN